MDIKEDWQKIRGHFRVSFKSNFHVSIASVGSNGNPTVTPIGSLFLNDNQTGYYFERFPSKLPTHVKFNNNVCILSVNSGRWFWLKSLFSDEFKSYPALKLYGHLGKKRHATESEILRLQRRMKITKGLRGNRTLWVNMQNVRDIKFDSVEKINLGKMTRSL